MPLNINQKKPIIHENIEVEKMPKIKPDNVEKMPIIVPDKTQSVEKTPTIKSEPQPVLRKIPERPQVLKYIGRSSWGGEAFNKSGEFSRRIGNTFDTSDRDRTDEIIQDALTRVNVIPQSVYNRYKSKIDALWKRNIGQQVVVVPDDVARNISTEGRRINEQIEAAKAARQAELKAHWKGGMTPSARKIVEAPKGTNIADMIKQSKQERADVQKKIEYLKSPTTIFASPEAGKTMIRDIKRIYPDYKPPSSVKVQTKFVPAETQLKMMQKPQTEDEKIMQQMKNFDWKSAMQKGELGSQKVPLFDPITGKPNIRLTNVTDTRPLVKYDKKYGMMVREDFAPQPTIPNLVKGIEPSSIAKKSMEYGRRGAEYVRSMKIDTSGVPIEIKESPGFRGLQFAIPHVRESTARLVEFGGTIEPTLELTGKTAISHPERLPAMGVVGASAFVGGAAKQIEKDPFQFLSDIIVAKKAFDVGGMGTKLGGKGVEFGKKTIPPVARELKRGTIEMMKSESAELSTVSRRRPQQKLELLPPKPKVEVIEITKPEQIKVAKPETKWTEVKPKPQQTYKEWVESERKPKQTFQEWMREKNRYEGETIYDVQRAKEISKKEADRTSFEQQIENLIKKLSGESVRKLKVEQLNKYRKKAIEMLRENPPETLPLEKQIELTMERLSGKQVDYKMSPKEYALYRKKAVEILKEKNTLPFLRGKQLHEAIKSSKEVGKSVTGVDLTGKTKQIPTSLLLQGSMLRYKHKQVQPLLHKQTQLERTLMITPQKEVQKQQYRQRLKENQIQKEKYLQREDAIEGQKYLPSQVSPPPQPPYQAPQQKQPQYPRPYLDLYWVEDIGSENPIDLPKYKNMGEKKKRKKRKKMVSYFFTERESPIFAGAEKLFTMNPIKKRRKPKKGIK